MATEDPPPLDVAGIRRDGDKLWRALADATTEQLEALLEEPGIGAKNDILAELSRRRTLESILRSEELSRRISCMAIITSAAAIVAIYLAVAVALHWGPF